MGECLGPWLARATGESLSQAFREHGPLACVVLAVDLEPQELAAGQQGSGIVGRCVQALKASARLSDVIGRLSPTEFAVLAPGTDAAGARRLAERLASSVSTPAIGEPAAAGSGATPSPRVRCRYEAVANVGYAPIEPGDLLVRAAAAVRTRTTDSGSWLPRFDEGIGTAAP